MPADRATAGKGSWTDDYPPQPLNDYAFIADGERGALVGSRGEIAWMCAPSWDDEPVFGSLHGAGLWAVTPVGQRFIWGGYYEEGSLIWRSRWVTDAAVFECREALARPADPEVAIVLRRVIATDGAAPVRIVLDPRLGGGEEGLHDLRLGSDNVWEGRLGDLHLRCSGLAQARVEQGGLVAEVDVEEGKHHDLVLEIGKHNPTGPLGAAQQAWELTEQAWRAEVPTMEGYWARRDVRQSLAVVTGMTSSAGGMVAAATRSLPERAERGRDYDYRFAWIRDQAMVGQAVAAVGPLPLMESALDFVAARLREDVGALRPAYTHDGGPVPKAHRSALPGYPGAVDHFGNDAGDQFQLDVFGEILHLFASAARHGPLSAEAWRTVETTVAAISDNWRRPDSGIWELDARRWTHSRQMLVSGIDSITAIAPPRQRRDWSTLGEQIALSLQAECLHPSGRWQRAPDDAGVDSALLIPVVRQRAQIAPDEPARRTVLAVLEELSQDEFCYRFRHDGPGSLASQEGAFVLSGFHMAMALERLGEHTLAARWFERARATCGPPGLFTEEYDVVNHQQRGNVPQAFVHGAMIETSATLSR